MKEKDTIETKSTEPNCRDCAHAHKIEAGVYECDAEQYDIEKLTCFKPRK